MKISLLIGDTLFSWFCCTVKEGCLRSRGFRLRERPRRFEAALFDEAPLLSLAFGLALALEDDRGRLLRRRFLGVSSLISFSVHYTILMASRPFSGSGN